MPEAIGPVVPSLVLDLDVDKGILDVGDFDLRRNVRPAEVQGARPHALLVTIVANIVRGISTVEHSSYAGEGVWVSGVGVSGKTIQTPTE